MSAQDEESPVNSVVGHSKSPKFVTKDDQQVGMFLSPAFWVQVE